TGAAHETEQAAVGVAANHGVRIVGIRHDVTALASANRFPIAWGNRAVVAAARDANGTAVLLRSVDPIGKTVVDRDVVELRRRLVIPGAPCLAFVDADRRALIDAGNHAARV